MTESRIEAARHANPLTFLPGNIPISEHLSRLLEAKSNFVVCYADLSNFKPFNDYFGYWQGDKMIQLLATTIRRHCDPQCDFIGHVGGDDFVVLFQSDDWESRCHRMVMEFNQAAVQLYSDEARVAGGIQVEDRQGVQRFFTFTTMYAGLVKVTGPSCYTHASDLATAAARAKQVAKTQSLSVFMAEPAAVGI